MYKYYYKKTDGVIEFLGKSKKIPKNCEEITMEDYEKYISVLSGIEDKEDCLKVVTLYVDFTFEVEYVPIEEEE